MVSSNAKTVEEYLESLPEDRRAAIAKVRQVILDNLPEGYEEGMQYGMIGYYVPLEEYPDTYNGQPLGIIALASQKNYMSLYLMSVYGDSRREKAFVDKYKASGKKLDMGKSCVRFKTLDDLPLDLVAETVASVPVAMFIGEYEESRAQFKKG
jgi:uncharacterized protein YdhG (YjbR/CyaY superfamily)